MNRRLLVIDRYDASALDDVLADPTRSADTDVLLLGLSHAWRRWQCGVSVPNAVDQVPLASVAHEAVERFVTETVATLPDRPVGEGRLSDLFESPGGNLWWYLDVSERGPYRGPLVQWLYHLAMVRAAIDAGRYDEVTAQVADVPLAEALRMPISADERARVRVLGVDRPVWRGWGRRPMRRHLRTAITAAAGALMVRAMSRIAGWPTFEVEPGGLASFTFYPAWWSSPFSGAAGDRFFSDLEGAGLSRYLTWLTSPGRLWRNRSVVRDVVSRRRMVVLQRFVSWRVALSNLSPREIVRVRRALHLVRQAIQLSFAGFEVGPMLERAIAESVAGGELCQNRLLAAALRRATRAGAPGTVTYRAEFQPTESALLRGLGGRSRTLGFVHYPFGRRYLSMRFTPGERAAVGRSPDAGARPMPDGLLACGEAGARHIVEAGYPAERVTICGPQRHGRLVEYLQASRPSRATLRARLGLPADRPVYFVALAILERDTEALFGTLMEAHEVLGPAYFVIRTHPNRSQGDKAMRAMLAHLGKEGAGLMPAGGDLYDYIAAADAMVCIGSMIAFEAMALGVVPIVFENPATYAATSLAEFEDRLFVVRSGRDLVRAALVVRDEAASEPAGGRCGPAPAAHALGPLSGPPLCVQMRAAVGSVAGFPSWASADPPFEHAGSTLPAS